MKTLELSAASKPLSDYADALNGDVLVLVSQNTPVAAIEEFLRISNTSVFLQHVLPLQHPEA